MIYKADGEVVSFVEGCEAFIRSPHRWDAAETTLEASEKVGFGQTSAYLAIQLDLSFARLQDEWIFIKRRLV